MVTKVEMKEQPEFCPTPEISEKKGFFRYPAHKVLGVFDAAENARAVIEALKAKKFTDNDIDIFCGEEGERQIDFSGERHGILASFVRSIQQLSAERIFLVEYKKELSAGHFLLAVHASDTERKKDAAEIMHLFNGRRVTYFGTWLIEKVADEQSRPKSVSANSYGYRRIVDRPFADAVARTAEALKKEGFGVLTEIDIKAKLKEKLDVDFQNYVILGACNPAFAHQALLEELDLGLLLPCNVIIYEQDEGSVVAAIDAKKMMSVVENPKLEAVSETVNEKLRRAIESI